MIFVDTSAWLALADSHDRSHGIAKEIARRIAQGEFGRQVTTNYVLVETLTLVRRQLGIPAALALAKLISGSREVHVFWIERAQHDQALGLMASHPDKRSSLTDSASFVVMRSMEISVAFSLDRGLVQAGFDVLPEAA
ncbi:MAG TPA: PIN domain-containing protein [Thermoplasmata archaeon]|nr:PIN domain-containing protein [Thermoplasmata archaeon]